MRTVCAWMLALVMMLCGLGVSLADPVTVTPDMGLQLSEEVIASIASANPEAEGVNPLTGLPAAEDVYTPITLVLDNSPEVYPHWGVSEADMIFQVPQRRDGGTRLVAVYSSAYPEQAGGARSSRMTTLPVGTLFDASPVYAGHPPVSGEDISVAEWVDRWDLNKPIKYVDLLEKKYKERVDFLPEPQNLSAHVKEIHEYLAGRATKKSATGRLLKYEKRYFLFSDEPLTAGDSAEKVSMRYFSRDLDEGETEPKENRTSGCTFTWTENGYTRTSKTGINTDRNTGETLTFANVILLRTPIEWDGNYPFYHDHLRGCGQAEFFMNGKHFTGAWYRSGRLSRLVLLDGEGKEISLQRGRSFIAIHDEYLTLSYE